MKLLILFQLCFLTIFLNAQDGLIGEFSTGWGNGCQSMSSSAGSSRIYTGTAASGANRYFRMCSGSNQFSPSATCTNGDDKDVTSNAGIEETSLNDLCTNGAWYINVTNSLHNYVFKTRSSSGASFVYFKVEGTVQTVASVTSPAAVGIQQPYSVTATLSLSLIHI